MTRKFTLLGVIIGILWGGCASAPDFTYKESEDTKVFYLLDRNRDNLLSLEEFLPAVSDVEMAQQVFRASDRDGDNHLGLEECAAALHVLGRRRALKREVLRLTGPRGR
ncbi:MAG: hypothetical protein QXT73_08255 [Candidatus Methanomethylicaceae archaeon]